MNAKPEPNAEQSVVGGLILDSTAFPRVAGIVSAEDFWRREHRLIFNAIEKLHQSGVTADVVTVSHFLSDDLDAAGGLAYLGSLANNTPSAANVTAYAEIVATHARERRLRAAAADVADGATDPESLERLQRAAAQRKLNGSFTPAVFSRESLGIQIPPREFVVESIIFRGCVAEMSGAHGISKSTAALDLCLAGVCGFVWGGLQTNIKTRVVFASREDAKEDILRRIQAWLANVGTHERAQCEHDIVERLVLLGRSETAELKLTSLSFGRTVINHEAVALVADQCKGADLIVLETVSRLHAGDESNESLSVFADALEMIAERTGAAVLVIRHVSKAAAREKTTDSYVGRGGAALSDAARSVLIMTALEKTQAAELGIETSPNEQAVCLTHAKASYGAKAEPIYFVRRPGPVLSHARTRDKALAEDDSLLAYLREQQTKGEPPSSRQISRDSVWHGIAQRRTETVLKRLADANRVRPQSVRKRGGSFTVWVPT